MGLSAAEEYCVKDLTGSSAPEWSYGLAGTTVPLVAAAGYTAAVKG